MLNFNNNKMIPIPRIHAKKAFSKNDDPNLICESNIQALGGDDIQHHKQLRKNNLISKNVQSARTRFSQK